MKRVLAAGLVLLLILALFSACQKNNGPEDASSTAESGSPAGPDQEEAALRTLAAWDQFTLCGPLRDVLGSGFETVSLSGARSSEDAEAVSLSFSFGKARDGGYLNIAGSVFLGKDASGLLDLDTDEPAGDPNALIFDTAAERIGEAGGSVEKKESGGISWNYGFAGTGSGDAGVARLLAWSELSGGILYVDVTAADASGKPADSLKQSLENWLLRLTLNGAPETKKQEMCLPFSGKTLAAEDLDVLAPFGAALSWNAGDGYLDAAYSGAKEDHDFYCTLKNKAAAGEETAAAIQAAAKEALESPLSWKTNISGSVLTAVAEAGNDLLLFELDVTPYGDTVPEDAFTLALDWLKTVDLR